MHEPISAEIEAVGNKVFGAAIEVHRALGPGLAQQAMMLRRNRSARVIDAHSGAPSYPQANRAVFHAASERA
jgi:hypothetical protein